MAKKKSWSTNPAEEPEPSGRPSKSKAKREHLEYQQLASKLMELTVAQLKSFPLSDDLFEALKQGKLIDSHGALRRNLRFLGKLISVENADDIQEALDRFHQPHVQSTHQFHQFEAWRERLLGQDPNSLELFLTEFPNADRQHLEAMLQKTKQELQSSNKTEYRKLFRYLSTLAK